MKPSSNYQSQMPFNKNSELKKIIFENFSYKLVSLFVALVLWLAILGRRDFIAVKEVEVLFTPGQGYAIVSQSADKIRMKISGSQNQIKKSHDRLSTVMIDVSHLKDGNHEVDISSQVFDFPNGIKVLSIKPNVIKIEISGK